jgi:hypothetical protein
MMPEGATKMIRSVKIFHNDFVVSGFQFFEKEGKLIFKIGDSHPSLKVDKVGLADNEVIIGVVARLIPGLQSRLANF